MGLSGYGDQKDDGVALLDLCKNHHLQVANIYFWKDREKLITYKSGDASTQLHYVLHRPRSIL